MADSTNHQPPAGQSRGFSVPPAWPGDPAVDAEMEAESQADYAAKLAPIDWPSIDRIYDDPMGPDGLPPWPEDMHVPEPGDDWWMR